MRRVRARTVGGVGILVFAALQLVRPGAPGVQFRGDGEMRDHFAVPPSVDSILRAACFDCHSSETRWPWYSQVAPVSWLAVWDVRRGRSDLDFSSWSTDPVREPTPRQRLRWICEEADDEAMPPFLYRLLHPEARLTDGAKRTLCEWTARALEELQ